MSKKLLTSEKNVIEDSGLLNYSEFIFFKNHLKKIKNNVTTL